MLKDMRKEEAHLSELTLRELNLEELAMHYDHVVDDRGQIERIGRVDQKELRKKIIELNRKGREAMQPFMDWQVEHYGESPATIGPRAMMVWRMVHEKPSDPVSFLINDPDRYTHIERLVIRKQFTRFGTWLIENAERTEDVEYGKRIINRLQDVPTIRKLREKPAPKDANRTPPMDPQDFARLMSQIDTRARKLGPRVPWYRPILRFALKSGQVAGYSFVESEKRAWLEAIKKHESGEAAGLSVWGKRAKAQIIPVTLVYDEMKEIASWPFPWGVIADLIVPNSLTKSMFRTARNRIAAEIKETCKDAGIPWVRSRTTQAIRHLIMKQIWETTHDYLLVQSMFGLNITNMKRFAFFDKEPEVFKEGEND